MGASPSSTARGPDLGQVGSTRLVRGGDIYLHESWGLEQLPLASCARIQNHHVFHIELWEPLVSKRTKPGEEALPSLSGPLDGKAAIWQRSG